MQLLAENSRTNHDFAFVSYVSLYAAKRSWNSRGIFRLKLICPVPLSEMLNGFNVLLHLSKKLSLVLINKIK